MSLLRRMLSAPVRRAAIRSYQPCHFAPRPFQPLTPVAAAYTVRFQAAIRKHASSTSSAAFSSDPSSSAPSKPSQPLPHKPAPHRNPDEPIYQLTFTCKACQHRSSHTISKQGYHQGTVLITCPGCKNRHLISDHLHIFSDTKVTIEDIMRQKGEGVQRGSITPDGDVEFWSEDAAAHGEGKDSSDAKKP